MRKEKFDHVDGPVNNSNESEPCGNPTNIGTMQ